MRLRIGLAVLLAACLVTGSTVAAAGLHRAHRRHGDDSDRRRSTRRARLSLRAAARRIARPTRAARSHFLNLAPGTYTVSTKLDGFTDLRNERVEVGTGVSVPLKISLNVAGVATAVDVVAETPVIDVKRLGTQTNVTLDELQNIPSSRDPWVVMQTVPGIVVDRVNVGRRRVGPAVELQRERRGRQRKYLEPGRHPDHRYGRDGIDADLLRLRHVPGDAGHDGRRRHHEPDAGRAVELRAEERHEHAARLSPRVLLERGHAGEQHA